MRIVKNLMKSILRLFDVETISPQKLEILKKKAEANDFLEILLTLPNEHSANILKYFEKSKSQLKQDLFTLSQLNFKRNGFFVEFGATNGIDLSNTHLLEKEFGWTGILAEPARCWHEDLKNNRSASIETRCVWKESDSTLNFNEVDIAELSTINAYSGTDSHKKKRNQGKTYDVKTISLNELLVRYNAPQQIDYLSIDTEGSEFEILGNFDFSKHSFRVITCEQNYTPMRDQIFDLLSKNGYVTIYQNISKWDDWYVKSN